MLQQYITRHLTRSRIHPLSSLETHDKESQMIQILLVEKENRFASSSESKGTWQYPIRKTSIFLLRPVCWSDVQLRSWIESMRRLTQGHVRTCRISIWIGNKQSFQPVQTLVPQMPLLRSECNHYNWFYIIHCQWCWFYLSGIGTVVSMAIIPAWYNDKSRITTVAHDENCHNVTILLTNL